MYGFTVDNLLLKYKGLFSTTRYECEASTMQRAYHQELLRPSGGTLSRKAVGVEDELASLQAQRDSLTARIADLEAERRACGDDTAKQERLEKMIMSKETLLRTVLTSITAVRNRLPPVTRQGNVQSSNRTNEGEERPSAPLPLVASHGNVAHPNNVSFGVQYSDGSVTGMLNIEAVTRSIVESCPMMSSIDLVGYAQGAVPSLSDDGRYLADSYWVNDKKRIVVVDLVTCYTPKEVKVRTLLQSALEAARAKGGHLSGVGPLKAASPFLVLVLGSTARDQFVVDFEQRGRDFVILTQLPEALDLKPSSRPGSKSPSETSSSSKRNKPKLPRGEGSTETAGSTTTAGTTMTWGSSVQRKPFPEDGTTNLRAIPNQTRLTREALKINEWYEEVQHMDDDTESRCLLADSFGAASHDALYQQLEEVVKNRPDRTDVVLRKVRLQSLQEVYDELKGHPYGAVWNQVVCVVQGCQLRDKWNILQEHNMLSGDAAKLYQ